MGRRGFFALGPAREIVILSMLLGIVLTGLMNGTSVLQWCSIVKAEVALNKGIYTVKSLSFDRDRQVYLAHSWPNELCEIHAETGIVTPIQVPLPPLQIAFIATSQKNSTKIMVTYSTDSTHYPKQVYVVRGKDLILSQDVPEEMSPLANVGISADGTIAELSGDDGTVMGFDLRTENPRQWQFNVGHSIFAERLSPDGNWLFASDGEENSYIYDLQTGKIATKVLVNRGCTRTVVWSSDSKHLAVSDTDGGLYIVDSSDGQIVWSRKMEFLFARSLAISEDGRSLGVGGLGKKIYIWDLSASSSTPPMIIKDAGVARNLQFTDSRKSVIAGNDDGSISEWSLISLQLIRKLR